jgi:hypothetical protein
VCTRRLAGGCVKWLVCDCRMNWIAMQQLNCFCCAFAAAVDAIMGEIDAWCAAHSLEEIMAAMTVARVPAGPILAPSDILKQPQYQARCACESAEHHGKSSWGISFQASLASCIAHDNSRFCCPCLRLPPRLHPSPPPPPPPLSYPCCLHQPQRHVPRSFHPPGRQAVCAASNAASTQRHTGSY